MEDFAAFLALHEAAMAAVERGRDARAALAAAEAHPIGARYRALYARLSAEARLEI